MAWRILSDAEMAAISKLLGGYAFSPVAVDERSGERVWPIEEYLARRRHGPAVRERIRRLNAKGKIEGEWPRGWHPHRRSQSFMHDTMSVRRFVEKFGRAAYQEVPKRAFIRNGHRKAVSMNYVCEMGPR